MLIGLVIAGQDLSDRGIPQGPPRRSPAQPGVVGAWSDLNVVKLQRSTDRCDSEPGSVLGDEPANDWGRGSHSRAKKDVAAFKISTVNSSSALRRRSSATSSADGAPGRSPASISASRTQRRSVS